MIVIGWLRLPEHEPEQAIADILGRQRREQDAVVGHPATDARDRLPRVDEMLENVGCRHRIEGAARKLEFVRSEEHTSELQSLMRISYAVFCLKKNTKKDTIMTTT